MSESDPIQPRKSPCGSCPYRCNVPSGVWAESEYRKLPAYDGEMHEQTSVSVFMCHQADGKACSGWLGHRDPTDMLAVRLGLMAGDLDPSCADYTTTVPLFESGEAAAEHGMARVSEPGDDAAAVINKLVRQKEARAEHGR
ncbi:DUF6283 family protein [Arthrobacter sp. zg-Y1110]|uniref:DUF6283 family protein n=1 Tax=Arthrobacter sp. zg-Y1110 TaxID=2886932 RepID=UPI001D14DEA2|nr:DUF6283 family protein [Arthrobacter sp. zg-Y1110]MCC3292397.1 DUF6283 family protein [Arthrobacter sp. zg-Y1110]UWX86700.1 DUF6283 family protein [Arthrobacter sp. zg-Y1110]